MEEEDLILSKSGGKVTSLGFTINSMLLQKGGSLMITKNSTIVGGGINKKMSDMLNNLAIPAGLAHIGGSKSDINSSYINNDEYISDDLYDKLFKLAEAPTVRKQTRSSNNNNKKNKTKRL